MSCIETDRPGKCALWEYLPPLGTELVYAGDPKGQLVQFFGTTPQRS